MPITRLAYLFQRYLAKTASSAEMDELMGLMALKENQTAVKALMEESWDAFGTEEVPEVFTPEQSASMLRAVFEAGAAAEGPVATPLVTPLRRLLWFRAAAAAVVLIVAGAGAWWLVRPHNNGRLAQTPAPVQRLLKGDLPPGTNKAMLILGDGTTVALDSAKNGTLAKQGYTQVLKVGGGELTYEPTTVEVGDSALVYNTVATPRGGEYRVVLPDGSRVWLNAASSIRFPTAFKGKDREVELTGEAYFEVAANPKQPFHVRVNDMQVKVLGTCFDVMAYEDEASITTSLLQGAVRVEQGGASDLLKPGQGASLNRLSGEMKIAPADTDQVVAWKNGLFLFEGVTIDRVMRQLARWYDIEVVYDGQMSKHYSGGFSRNASLEEVLRVLQLGVKGRFVLEGKTVRVQSL